MICTAPSQGSDNFRVESTVIAKEAGKAHKNVLRDVEKMLSDLYEGRLRFEPSPASPLEPTSPDESKSGLIKSKNIIGCELSSYKNSQGKEQPCYLLDRRHAECLITGWDTKRRMAVIDRLHQLEEEARRGELEELRDQNALLQEAQVMRDLEIYDEIKLKKPIDPEKDTVSAYQRKKRGKKSNSRTARILATISLAQLRFDSIMVESRNALAMRRRGA